MLHAPRAQLFLTLPLALAACSPADAPHEAQVGGAVAAGPVEYAHTTLRTVAQARYVSAAGAGGGELSAAASQAQAWEEFTLIDQNGGALESGDPVLIVTGRGDYWQAAAGGGLNAASASGQAAETFRIRKAGGSGPIHDGDVVGLEASSGWVTALNGGGGAVAASGAALQGWEQFQIGLQAPWRPVWSDEFDGPRIDESKWVWEVQHPGWVNHELQNYTDHRAENARIEDGALIIEARKDGFEGHDFSSARLKTRGKASWTYGRVEARISVPGGLGTWPAFWMMPDDDARGWPACGEVDIMEEVGFDPDAIHATTHAKNYSWLSPVQRTAATGVAGATGEYHVYALEWFPDRIDVYVDGSKYFTSLNDNSGDDAWPFHKNFYIILNLAIGGDWGGQRGVDTTGWPRQMRVDYVRVYQK